jgi:hypothetical protein
MAWTIDEFLNGRPAGSASRLLKHALSTITSPSFLEVVIRYQHRDFCGILDSYDDPIFGLFVCTRRRPREKTKPSGITDISKRSVGAEKCETSNWCCVQRFWTVWGSTRCGC